jgi:hypothetical protein
MEAAAQMIEAIDNPRLQTQLDWNLQCWTYELVPWGVRFNHRNGDGATDFAVVALVLPERMRRYVDPVHRRSACPTEVLLLE